MKNRGILTTLLAAVVFLFIPLSAQALPQLDRSEHIYDEVGVIEDDDRRVIQETMDELHAQGIPYYLTLVRDFEGRSVDEWCRDVGNPATIEDSAIIWSIASDLGEYTVCLGESAIVDQNTAMRAAERGANNLDSENFTGYSVAGAVAEMGRGLMESLEQPEQQVDTSSEEDSAVVDVIAYIIVIIIFVVVPAALIYLVIHMARKRNKKGSSSGPMPAGRPLPDPAHRAQQVNVRLMQVDDTVRAASDDLAFARAQFGELETDQFKKAVSTSEQKMTEAFQLQSKYGDATSDQQKHDILSRIETLCNEVERLLDAHVKQFAELRNVEANIGKNITTMRSRVEEARARNRRAVREIENLQLTRSDHTLKSILDNPETADRLLDAADQALNDAEKTQDSDRHDSVFSINLAQRALGQALAQIDEVMNASDNLDDAKRRLSGAIASISSDLDDVSKLAPGQQAFTVLVADAREAIDFGHQARKGQADPLSALSKLREAEDALDRALAPLRNKASQDARNRQRLDSRFAEVDNAIMRADAHISANLYVAGSTARSLVAEAKDKRMQAANIAPRNPGEALSLLSDALIAANRAIDISSGPSGGGPRSSNQQQSGVDIGSLILGGLLFGGGNNSSYHHNNSYNHKSRTVSWSKSSSKGSWGGFSSGGRGSFGGGFGSGGGGSFGGGFSSGGSGKF